MLRFYERINDDDEEEEEILIRVNRVPYIGQCDGVSLDASSPCRRSDSILSGPYMNVDFADERRKVLRRRGLVIKCSP